MRPMLTARAARARFVIVWGAVGLMAWATTAWAAVSPEQRCQAGRARAAGKYAKCIQNAVARNYLGGPDAAKLGKCVTKYGKAWDRLQVNALASPGVETCDAARFVDNGDGTVTDNLSALQWEKKTDDATIHDKDNSYDWSSSGTAADGTVWTTFVTTLNTAAFAGQHDWRLPTLVELLSIAQPVYPDCSAPPCIAPIFGPTQSFVYWSSSPHQLDPPYAWVVMFNAGRAGVDGKTGGNVYVRAVRGGF